VLTGANCWVSTLSHIFHPKCLKITFSIILHLHLGLASGSFQQTFCVHSQSFPCVLHASTVSSSFIRSVFCLVSTQTQLAFFLHYLYLYWKASLVENLRRRDVISKDFFPLVRGLFQTNDSTLIKCNGSTTQHPVLMAFHTVFTVGFIFIKYTVIAYGTIAPRK
jgi:hypothetical protein